MNAPEDCPLTQQAVGWALHALEPDEEMAVLLHMPQCSACRAAAHDAEQVLSWLDTILRTKRTPDEEREHHAQHIARVSGLSLVRADVAA